MGWLDLEGVANMRDLGGVPTRSGDRIRPRRLLRSDNLQDLSASDVQVLLEDLDVTDVVDLRSTTEVNAEGPGPLMDRREVTVHHHSLVRDQRRAATTKDTLVLAGTGATPADADYWSRHYLGYLADRPESVVASLRAIASARGAAVVHCAAGKDRTGTVVGMALSLVGVADELVVADYVASAERIERILDRLKVRPSYADLVRARVQDQMPKAETMEQLFGTLNQEHGGALGWLAAHGWTDQDSEQLRLKLLG
ncbi:tyrosine-protein phosphatase [Nocardioides sp. JQ2195]|nr:tyrosine-protein phosphatase [Nocardioides sp. JQ2195]